MFKQVKFYSKFGIYEITQSMFSWSSDFNKKSFLNEGAIYGTGDSIYFLWGTEKSTQCRPRQPAIWAPEFFLRSGLNWIPFSYGLKITREKAKNLFTTMITDYEWLGPSKAAFKIQFERIQSWITKGEVTKVVPYVFESTQQEVDSNSLESYLSCALEVEQGYIYGCWKGAQGILGVTPEVLVTQKDDQNYETMSLAGTYEITRFNQNPSSFINDSKESKEHEIVVSEIKNSLKTFGQVVCGERSVQLTPHLAHLYTPIQMIGDRVNFFSLISALHPTPALGCSPRSIWKVIMGRLNELLPRNQFGAPFAISVGERQTQVLVAIRNIQWSDGKIQLGSGCGVVQESEFEKEWLELTYKRQSVKKMLGLL